MKVLHDKGIFSIEGITVINPEIMEDEMGFVANMEIKGLADNLEFYLPENIIAEKIEQWEDREGNITEHGSVEKWTNFLRDVYRLKLKEPLVEEKAMKVKCNCPCHKNKAYKHVIQCCEDGYIEFPKFPKEQSPLVDTGSKEEILKRRGSLHVINGINFYTTDGIYVAMEEYSSQQLSEYKEKLKAEIEKEEHQIAKDSFEFGWNKALEKVLTLIDKSNCF